MTIKKIGLSALVASAIVTNSFAGSSEANVTGIKYNTAYLTAMGKTNTELGEKIKSFDLNTSSDIHNKNVINFEIVNAQWGGKKDNYVINYNDSKGNNQIVNSSDIKNNIIKFVVTNDINKSTIIKLYYNETSSTDLNITLPYTTKGDVKIKTSARDNENDIDIAGANTKATIAKEMTLLPTAIVNCSDVTIDIDNKNRFKVNGKSDYNVSTSRAECDINISKIDSNSSYVDFNYSDINATAYMYPGDFIDGNFSDSNDSKIISFGKADASKGQTIYLLANSTTDFNLSKTNLSQKLYYELTGSNQLNDAQFKTKIVLTYQADKDENKTQTVFSKQDTMKWTLPVFTAKVLNMRSNAKNKVNTFIKLYNSSKEKAIVDVEVVTVNGKHYSKKDIATVPAGGAITVSASDINSQITEENLKNGYSATLSYEKIDRNLGDAVASQTEAQGSYPIRIKTNKTVDMSTDGYKGI